MLNEDHSVFSDLTIVTPVTRPFDILLVERTIPPEAEWLVLSDGAISLPPLQRATQVVKMPESRHWGDPQRQLGIEMATREFVYFLDDDNLFCSHLARIGIPWLQHSGDSAILVGLIAYYFGQVHVWPAPSKVERSRVDTSMCLVRRKTALEIGWPDFNGDRGADYAFLKRLEDFSQITSLPLFLAFHDGLRLIKEHHSDIFRRLQMQEDSSEELCSVLSHWLNKSIVPNWYLSTPDKISESRFDEDRNLIKPRTV